MSTNAEGRWFWGPYSRAALWAALITLLIDQTHKWWMILHNEIREKGQIYMGRYLDYKWRLNTGISYSLLDQASFAWQLTLTVFALIASALLWVWVARGAHSKLMGLSLGLVIGGAISNGLDRIVHGGVVDYISVHFPWGQTEFYWFIFNIADVAIVAGVAGLLYDSLKASRNDAAKPL